jgi:hypothetical protein
MLNEAQLAKAVQDGIITDAQLKELKSLASPEAASASHSQTVEDEAPRFFRSFNDIFIGMGVAILGFALKYAVALVGKGDDFMNFVAPVTAVLIFWLLGEWLTAYKRINFPSIIIAIFFAYFVSQSLINGYEFLFLENANKATPLGIISICGLGVIAMGAFFLRFKLPFSVLLFAGSIAVFFLAGSMALIGKDIITPYLRWVTLAIGLSVFAAAMWFDVQDPHRTKRTSDQGFWLHLLAAPIITHSVLWTSLQPLISANEATAETNPNLMVVIVLSMFVLFSLVALIIDRRALLISSLGYAAAALGFIIYKFDLEGNAALIITMILIAALILSLGTGWYSLRKALFNVLPSQKFFEKLPPVAN